LRDASSTQITLDLPLEALFEAFVPFHAPGYAKRIQTQPALPAKSCLSTKCDTVRRVGGFRWLGETSDEPEVQLSALSSPLKYLRGMNVRAKDGILSRSFLMGRHGSAAGCFLSLPCMPLPLIFPLWRNAKELRVCKLRRLTRKASLVPFGTAIDFLARC
jgi:hypothetical protein